MKGRAAPYTLASSLAVLMLDWAIYAFTRATYAEAGWQGIALGASLALVCVTLFEYRSDDSLARALSKGLIAAAAVAVPFPLLGTALAMVGIVWTLTGGHIEPN